MGVDAKSIRLSLTYGPGIKKDDKRMLSNFIQKSITNKELKLLDHGLSTRTYLYVADAIIMMWNIMFKGQKNTYNVGGNKSKTIISVAKKVAKIIGVNVVLPDNECTLDGSPKSVKIDMSRYNNEFGDFQKTSIDVGLKNTINWYKVISENR